MNSVLTFVKNNRLKIQDLQSMNKRKLFLVVLPSAALVLIALVYLTGGRYVSSENAYVKADKVPISTEISGTVKEVLVEENQEVRAGDILFKLDPIPFQLAFNKAKAKLEQVKTDLNSLQSTYREKQAEIAMAKTRFIFAKIELKRQQELANKHFISASQFDTANQNFRLAKQQIKVLAQDLQRIRDALAGSVDSPIENHPNYKIAYSERQEAMLDLQRVVKHAPHNGVVSKLPKSGQFLAAGTQAMVLVQTDNFWVEANLTETELTQIKPGQHVKVEIDTYPHVRWQGVVDGISPATGAEFSMIPAQNATGNWVKIVQRIPVKIKLSLDSSKPQLRAGLSAYVVIDTHSLVDNKKV